VVSAGPRSPVAEDLVGMHLLAHSPAEDLTLPLVERRRSVARADVDDLARRRTAFGLRWQLSPGEAMVELRLRVRAELGDGAVPEIALPWSEAERMMAGLDMNSGVPQSSCSVSSLFLDLSPYLFRGGAE
jgi:hypothetical protein